jgi:cytochrome c biogenesis protein
MTETKAPAPPGDPRGPGEPESGPRPAPALGLRGALRFVWTQLTSMRTALILLFALAVAAIPGSLVPQRTVTPVAVRDFAAEHPRLAPIYDALGLFDVYNSAWFSAVYLLLFVSLVGCIIPRIGVYARALRSAPPPAPRYLSRFPAYATRPISEPATALEQAAAELRRRRYRVVTRDGSVSAERGYVREAGNLVFHVSLLFLLLGVALGGLFGFRGTSVVIEGQGFANTLTQYDDFTSGGRFSEAQLRPFAVAVRDFRVRFEVGEVQRGAARQFALDAEVTPQPGAAPFRQTIEVNRPLDVDGTTVHLIGHGYAPLITVTDGQGNVAFSGPVVFLPQDGNFTSTGVIKAPDGRPQRLAFEGIFAPTAVVDDRGPRSLFPDAIDPALYVNAWEGPPRVETGEPENVYSLNTAGLTQIQDAKGQPLRILLRPGTSFDLPDGRGTIRMDGVTRWVKLQISDTPGVVISLAAIGFAVLGLCFSLFVRPSRIWVRPRTDSEGRTLIEVAGLDRADARSGLREDVDDLAAVLAADPSPPPSGEGSDSS